MISHMGCSMSWLTGLGLIQAKGQSWERRLTSSSNGLCWLCVWYGKLMDVCIGLRAFQIVFERLCVRVCVSR